MSASPCTVDVGGERPYRIHIGPGLLHDGALLANTIRGRHVLLLSDSHVAPLYLEQVKQALQAARPGLKIGQFVLPAGEASKTLASFGEAITALATLGATRDACVLALGGGVVGDLAGFAAACWMRGIDCVQLPTTLLSMVDSSVGGKTAVDIPQGKNLVGAFHPPCAVIADTDALRTLPMRELRAGLAEVVKYGALGDSDFFDWLGQQRAALLAGDHAALAQAIARSCEHKARIVERDPLEKGERALLNLGHTFGHAIETAQGYGAPGQRQPQPWRGRGGGHGAGRATVGPARHGPGRRHRHPARPAAGLRPADHDPGRSGARRAARAHAPGQEEHRRAPAPGAVAWHRPRRGGQRRGRGGGTGRAGRGLSPGHHPAQTRAPATIRPMRVFLQQPPSGNENPRYVQLTLQPDLLGGWELLRESGQVGGRIQLRRELYLQRNEATDAFEKARDQQLKRGFQVMFTHGEQPR
jgi:3-dehydroquinate synthetase